MIIGFTGTRYGMTEEQKKSLRNLLLELGGEFPLARKTVHHGDCVGADREFHYLAAEIFGPCDIVIHPPEDDEFRAYC